MILFACVLAVAVVLLWPREREPYYQGKPLSEWIEMTASGSGYWSEVGTQSPEAARAAQALRQMGTNALPCLLKWVRYERPPWKDSAAILYRKWDRSARSRRVDGWLIGSAERQVGYAFTGFKILGDDASQAVPELTQLAQNSKSAYGRGSALFALAAIGQAGVPPLLAEFSKATGTNRINQLIGLLLVHRPGTNASRLAGTFIQCLGDTNPLVVRIAAKGLGSLGLEPSVSVPALTNCLKSSDPHVQANAAEALGRFGEQARSAVPPLTDLLNDPRPSTRNAATNALRNIAPELLPKQTQEAGQNN